MTGGKNDSKLLTHILWESLYKEGEGTIIRDSLCQQAPECYVNWMKVERALQRAELRLVRRVESQVWLIRYHRRWWTRQLRCDRKWKMELLNVTDYPGWYGKHQTYLLYNELLILLWEAETLVLRMRALKYHGSPQYLDPKHTKLPTCRGYDLTPPQVEI